MHILLFHQYHHNPDCPATCRHYEFAEYWGETHDVTIVSTDAWLSKRISDDFPWIPKGAELVSLPIRYDNKMDRWARLRSFLSYARQAADAGTKVRRPDVVIGTSTPLSVGWAARRVAAYWEVPFVFEIRDLWPDFPIEMGAIPRPLQRPLRHLEARLYRSADRVVTLSPDMTEHVRRSGVPVSQICTVLQGTNMALASKAAARSETNAQHRDEPKRFLYAGAFGRANDIETILATAEMLAGDPRIRFAFAGHGFHERSIRDAAARLPNVDVLGPQPHHQVFDVFASSYASLVTFEDIPSVSACSPSKLFDSLATGCPVIVNTGGWIRRLVEKHSMGWHVKPHDPEGLARMIVSLTESPARVEKAGSNARQFARTHFDRKNLAREFQNILESVVYPGTQWLGTAA